MSKSELYHEAKRRGLNPIWIGATKQDLLELLSGMPRRETNNRSTLYQQAKKLGYRKPWRRSTIAKLKNFIDNSFVRQVEKSTGINELKDFLNNPSHWATISISEYHPYDVVKTLQLKPFNDKFHLLLQKGVVTYTLNPANFETIYETLMSNPITIAMENLQGSDREIATEIMETSDNKKLIWLEKGRQRRNGGYFKYYNTLEKVDLSRYGIFHESDTDYGDNCLILALKNAGICEENLNRMKTIVKTRYIPKKDIKIIAEELGINIIIKDLNTSNNKQDSYGPSGTDRIVICLFNDHYFVDELTKYTLFSIQHYDEIDDIPNFNQIYKVGKQRDGSVRYRYTETQYAMSSVLIKQMFELYESDQKCFEPITLQNNGNSNFENKVFEYIKLPEPTMKDVKEYIHKDKTIKYDAIVYFDTEATTDGNIHEPYLICSKSRDGDKLRFTGSFCIINWLNMISNIYNGKRVLCIAHNLRYDFQFIVRYLYGCKDMIKTGNQIKSITGLFKNYLTKTNVKLSFKDSYAMISCKLADFGESFGLTQHKEVMPYNVFTTERLTYDKPFMLIEDALKEFQNKVDKAMFVNNIEKWTLYDDTKTKFDMIEYSAKYCEIDVDVLKTGYEIFREWMMEVTTIDIDQMVSLPQLSNKFGQMSGVFDGCYKLSGVPRDFIQRCVVGGRVMTNSNKQYSVAKEIDDFDGVSLYPSAMHRMDGLLKGIPKVWNSSVNLSKVDGYFLEINITAVNKPRAFPLLSKKNGKGIRDFSNDIRGSGVYVDKIGLEDLIKFQDIEYTIIRGYYYDSGRNIKIKSFIENLFNERDKKKKAGNPIQSVYKLIMNAFYGKMIMKPIKYNYTFKVGQNNIIKHLQYRFNNIMEYTNITDSMVVFKEAKTINDHFSLPHCGVEILSMSKRIMNEVICLAEDLNIMIYYQDTDSMHVDRENGNIQRLNNVFKETYGRELVGKSLGQFHSDFDYKSKDDMAYAVRSIFLGKKSYIDLVRLKNDGVITYVQHSRLKGIPTKSIENVANNMFNGDMVALYDHMLKHNGVEFDLVGTCKFKFNNNFTTKTNLEFKRMLKF